METNATSLNGSRQNSPLRSQSGISTPVLYTSTPNNGNGNVDDTLQQGRNSPFITSATPSSNHWSISRAAEFWTGNDNKVDTLDIRAITAAEKSTTGKRQKYRKTIHKKDCLLIGGKPSSADILGSLPNGAAMEKLYIDDARASTIRIDYNEAHSQFICRPSIERFSAHTGICQVIGSRNVKGEYYPIRVGDILRFGSVGFLVTEINTNGEGQYDSCLSPSEIQDLLHHIICYEDDETVDSTGENEDDAAEKLEDAIVKSSIETSSKNSMRRQSTSEVPLCYICYETGTTEDPLISPCKCIGDTKYIHLNCLKKWNTSTEKNDVCTILDENPNHKCSICQAIYPAKTKLSNGSWISLLPDRLGKPSLVLMLITKHTSSNTLVMNARYELSMKTLLESIPTRPLRIGRSSQCDFVLKYRTVSTIHAEMIYNKGEFYITDLSSSNGTLRYIYQPLPIIAGKTLNIKFGRTIVYLKTCKRIRLPALLAGMMMSSRQATPNGSDDEQNSRNNTPNQNHLPNVPAEHANSSPSVFLSRLIYDPRQNQSPVQQRNSTSSPALMTQHSRRVGRSNTGGIPTERENPDTPSYT